MKKFLLLITLLVFGALLSYAQVPVTKSSDTVRVGNKLYYTHVVQPQQTLYSIGKAYGVISLDIIDCNPKLALDKNPIHPGDVLLIPVVDNAPQQPEPETKPRPETVIELVDSVLTDNIAAPADSMLCYADTTALNELLDSLALTQIDSIVIEEPVQEPVEEPFVYDYADRINVALLLPIAADSTANTRYLNFYFGALLAARDLANSGIDMDITTLDTASPRDTAKIKRTLDAADVIIGPVSSNDIKRTLALLPEKKFIVSPMDTRTESFTDDNRVILAATPASRQIDDMISWLAEDMAGRPDSLIVVSETGYKKGASVDYILDTLSRDNVPTLIDTSYALSGGLEMNEYFAIHTHLKDTVTRVVAASEHDVFVKDVIRNVALQNYLKHNVVIYGPAKTKSPDMDEMCGANLHTSVTYYINYNDPKVISFVNDYRAIFQTDPDNFAFHGYDTMRYFVSICNEYGRNWEMKLEEFDQRGLQTSFHFTEEKEKTGHVNSGLLRLVYSPGFKTSIVRCP